MRIALAVFMVFHGIAHLVGFAGSWGLLKNVPRKTTILSGRADLGETGIRIYGVVWLILAIAFLFAAIAAGIGAPGWVHWTPWVALASLVLCGLAWPDAPVGLAANVVILALLHLGARNGWF